MDNKLNYHRRKFDEDVLTKKQEPTCRIWSKEEIQTTIGQLSNSNGAKRSMKRFRVLKAFESMELRYLDPYNMDQTCNPLKVVASEDLFDQIYGHGNKQDLQDGNRCTTNPRTRILHQYGIVRLFLEHSPNHQARISRNNQKSLVTNPILSSSFASRGQVDLIDMRTVPDGEFKWILNYQDHFTKWVVLKGLKEKNAREVVINLVTIFYTLGAPNILQSANGKELDDKLLLEPLNALWPSTKRIHGKPRKPQSQGSVKNVNNRVQNILQCILEREGHTHWAKVLDKVAYMKNTSLTKF